MELQRFAHLALGAFAVVRPRKQPGERQMRGAQLRLLPDKLTDGLCPVVLSFSIAEDHAEGGMG